MSNALPYSTKDVPYDNAKFRHRSFTKVINQTLLAWNIKRGCLSCSTGKFLFIALMLGLVFIVLNHTGSAPSGSVRGLANRVETEVLDNGSGRLRKFWQKPSRLPPRLSPDESSDAKSRAIWVSRRDGVKDAFVHAWSGYAKYAMGYDELSPLSQSGHDGLGGLGATIVDALDTAIIMGADDIVSEAGSWIESHLLEKISHKGQVNLFETTIRVVGGLLSAYHLSGGAGGIALTSKGPKPAVYLETAKNLTDSLLSAFTSSPTAIPYSDVVLRDSSAHPAPDGRSSTSEVSTVQLEFNYLSMVSGDKRYSTEGMKVMEHIKTLPKVEGLVPIYMNPHTGEFDGENIRLGSRGDSYYEYLLKVWLQQGADRNDINYSYLHDMYTEAMKGVRSLLVRKSVPNGLVLLENSHMELKAVSAPKWITWCVSAGYPCSWCY